MVHTKPVRPVQLKNTSRPLSAVRPLSDDRAAGRCLLGVTNESYTGQRGFPFAFCRRLSVLFKLSRQRRRDSGRLNIVYRRRVGKS